VKRRFRAALALAGLTQTEWARRQRITQSHLSQVLDGKRISVSLAKKIDAFIARRLATQRAA
jgi:transcriptional regulator with XRE-family HTH domain